MQASSNPNPNQNPSSHSDPYSSHLYTTQACTSYYTPFQSQSSNPTTSISHDRTCNHPEQQSLSLFSYSNSHVAGYEAHYQVNSQANAVDPMTFSSLYCQDLSGFAAGQTWPAMAVEGQQQMPSLYLTGVAALQNGTQQLFPANKKFSTLLSTTTTQTPKSVTWKKAQKRQAKVVQSAWCEICMVNCNSKDVLEHHKLGKKHLKNKEKLAAVATPANMTAEIPLIGPQEDPDKGKSSGSGGTKSNNKAALLDKLDTKRRKVLEGGAAAGAVRVCVMCNVVCNSEIVFRYHLAGQKHASMMNKHTSGAG